MSHVLIEKFLEGTNHGFTAMLYRGKVVFSMLDMEYHEHSPFAVSAASVPEPMPEGVVRNLREQIERMADGLKLCDGLVHSQFILTRVGKPVILEVCRRSPGDPYIDFVKYAMGVDYPGLILSCEAGRGMDAWMKGGCLAHGSCGKNGAEGDCEGGGIPKVKGFWGRHVIVCKRAGRLKDVVIGNGLASYIRGGGDCFREGEEDLRERGL